MKISKRLSLILIFFLLYAVTLPSLTSHADENRKIKIGYFNDGDYMSLNEQGHYTGFNIEYLQQLSKYTGWEYDFVDCGSLEKALESLASGAIDIVPGVYRSDARTKTMYFSEAPMCNVYTTLSVRSDDIRYDYEDYESFDGIKAGVISGSLDEKHFKKYCRERNISPSIIPYTQNTNLFAALERRDLDAVVLSSPGKSLNLRNIAEFSPNALYFAVSKKAPQLLSSLNSALSSIKLRTPHYETALYDKYFSVSEKQVPVFSPEEKEFVKNAGTINAIYASRLAPLEYTNSENGKFNGIVADVFQVITDLSGLQFSFIPDPNYEDVIDGAKNNTADVVCSAANDYIWAEEKNIHTTASYLTTSVVVISSNHTAMNRIAMPRGYLLTEEIKADNPSKEILLYDSPEDCFTALLNNEADITYANTYISDYLLSYPLYSSFSVATLADYSDDLSIGVSRETDPRLFSIMDKCLQYISSNTMNQIILDNTLLPHQHNLQYIIKQYPIQSLGIVLAVFMALTCALMSALLIKNRSHRKIQEILYLDGLTHIWNLNKFRLEAARIMEQEKKQRFAFLYVDINQFKTINDTFGFSEGDWILCTFARVLKDSLLPQEYCARVSADQFVLLLHYESWAKLTDRTKQIDLLMNELLSLNHRLYHLILIFGVYVVDTVPGQDVSLMLDFANYARKSTKITHKSITIKYDKTMREEELAHRDLANKMHEALKNQEFLPYLQPKYNMKTHEIIGAEALVRWVDSTGTMQMPGSFVPFFEQNGFIVEVDFYIFEAICRQIRQCIDKKQKVIPVSTNFSRKHFKHPDFVERLCKIADRHRVPHQYLELEITESAVTEEGSCILETLAELKTLGFIISIDDFGSGYSSLGMLHQINVDVVKLDRSFLQKGISKDREKIIIQGVIDIIGKLGISIICEGVRDQAEADMLMKMGCFQAQSFFYGKPMPTADFCQLVHPTSD